MGRKLEACAECKRICFLCHAKRKNSKSLISSFFKVMIGDQFSKVLFLPPKFAREISALIDQEMYLEDCSGMQWQVKLTMLNDSLALYQGWDAFASDHELEIGDFVVFHYIMGSHIVVQIYDKTGCEKQAFSERRNLKKRAKTDGNFTAKDGSCHTIDKGSMNKQGSSHFPFSVSGVETIKGQGEINDGETDKLVICSTSNEKNRLGRPPAVSQVEFIEEPCYRITREFGGKAAGYQRTIFDLSNNSGTGPGSGKIIVGGEICSDHVDTSLKYKNEAGLGSKGLSDKLPSSSLQPVKMFRNNSDQFNNRVMKRCWTAEGTDKAQPMKKPKIIKIEPDDQICDSPVGCSDKVLALVKLEGPAFDSLPSLGADCISCLIADNSQPFLELPAALPLFSNKRKARMESRVVLLRDPEMRLWPVLYHETSERKILKGGWEAFCKTNNIQPGDKCIFGVESKIEDGFRVTIVRK